MRRFALTPLVTATWLSAACTSSAPDRPVSDSDETSASSHPAVSDPRGYDSEHPPRMLEFSFESAGSKLNAIMYLANGPGPHPTAIFLHVYPGNERNLDLAQAVRRSGANAMFFNYRGSWGSGGEYGIGNSIEDVARAAAVRITT